jgi:hypothetical protein
MPFSYPPIQFLLNSSVDVNGKPNPDIAMPVKAENKRIISVIGKTFLDLSKYIFRQTL